MKLYALSIVNVSDRQNGRILASESELSSFNYFTRSSVQEFITFMSKTVAERTDPGIRQTVKQDEYVIHSYGRSDGLCGIAVCDAEYHTRVAFSVCARILDDFNQKFPNGQWKSASSISFPELKPLLTKYQNPTEADSISKVQKELDETKEILVETLDLLMKRGEKLDDLVAKSNDLSFSSKKFYTEAKKQNQCCVVS